jgi:glycosyltransferase involved in cell wall biosynthesis
MNRPLHIAFTTPAWPLGIPNGIVTYVHNIRQGLLALGHRVSVFSGAVPTGTDLQGVHHIAGGTSYRWRRRLARLAPGGVDVHQWSAYELADSIARVHARDPIDLVEMEETQGWFSHVQSKLPIPVVPKLHGPGFLTESQPDDAKPQPGNRTWREGEALRASRFLCSPSSAALRLTLERYNLSRIDHAVLPNPALPVLDDALQWTRQKAEPKTLLYVGRFEHVKGGDVVLKAFRRALDRDPSLRLLFVGPHQKTVNVEGRDWTIDEAVNAWFEPSQRSAVQVLGAQPAAEVAKLRCRARLTLMTSRFETQSMVVVEAMSQGCPTVATAVGGAVELIDNERTGLLAASEDIESIAAQILRLVNDDALAERLGAAGRAWVCEHLNPKTIAERNAQWYQHVIEQARTTMPTPG